MNMFINFLTLIMLVGWANAANTTMNPALGDVMLCYIVSETAPRWSGVLAALH